LAEESGITINVGNLRATCEALASSLGTDRLNRILATFRPQETRGLAAYHLMRAQAHPLAVEWRELMQAVQKSEEDRTLALPERSLFFLDQLVRLRSVLNVPGIDRILQRVEQGDHYYSAMFEILVLSLYRQKGAEIEVVAEAEQPGKPSPDFVIRGTSQDVYVECKSLEDRSRKEQRIWEQIEAEVMKAMSSYARFWRVSITATRIVEGRDIEALVSLASERIRNGILDRATTADGTIELTFEEVDPSPETWRLGGIDTIERRTQQAWIEAEQYVEEGGAVFHRNAMIIEVIPFQRENETDRILDDVNDAHRQIPRGACGIVHIEIPFRQSKRLLDIADYAFQRTFGFLRTRQRLNAVVLSARTMTPGIKDGDDAVMDYFVIVPSPNPAVALPNEFEILGSESGSAEMRKPRLWHSVRWYTRVLRQWILSTPRVWPRKIRNKSDLLALPTL
jgi:hypothetical protein